jgi:predicted nucleotidyltransferase
MDPEIVAQVQRRLDAAARAEEVTLPLAVESGSRAWGFPSQDSDYDCRFLYIRRTEDYLSPWRKRDVIETPVDTIYDVSGWDLAKALQLLLKGNAVVLEWLTSPIAYRRDARFVGEFLELATSVVDRRRICRHYLHLGETQQRRNLADETAVARKKLFYALRPAAALRWMRLHPSEVAPPMNFLSLMESCAPPQGVFGLAQELIAEKAATGEMVTAPLDRTLARFVEDEFEIERARGDVGESDTKAWAQRLAEDFFIAQLRRSEVGGFG